MCIIRYFVMEDARWYWIINNKIILLKNIIINY